MSRCGVGAADAAPSFLFPLTKRLTACCLHFKLHVDEDARLPVTEGEGREQNSQITHKKHPESHCFSLGKHLKNDG